MIINNRRLLAVVTIMLSLILLASCTNTSSGSGDNADVNEEATVIEDVAVDEDAEPISDNAGWEYFEDFNPIGMEFSVLADKYDLSEDVLADGGRTFHVNNEVLYFGFPILFEPGGEVAEDALCSSVYGTLSTVFGIDSDLNIEELETLLNVSFGVDPYDGLLTAAASSGGRNYLVSLNVTDRSAVLTPDDGIDIYNEDD